MTDHPAAHATGTIELARAPEALSRYTPHASAALWTALRIASYEPMHYAEPRHLLWAILEREDFAAVRLLRHMGQPVEAMREACAVQPNGPPESRVPYYAAEMAGVRYQARDAAETLGDRQVGTTHLLLGLLTDRGIARRLRPLRVTAEQLKAEIIRLGKDPSELASDAEHAEVLPATAPGPYALRPNVVNFVGIWIVLQFLCGGAVLPGIMSAPGVVLLELVVRNALFLSLYIPLLRGDTRAWAGITALLFMQSALWCAGVALLLVMVVPATAGQTPAARISALFGAAFLALPVWGLLTLTRSLFAARWWFGVRDREGWTVLRRRGGWVVAAMGLLYAMELTLMAWGGFR